MRVLLLVLAALVLAAPAAAKNLTDAQVCGQAGCAVLPRDEQGDGLIQLRGSEGRAVVGAPAAAPYYRLIWEFTSPAGAKVRTATLYVPSADLIAAQGMALGSVEWFGASEAVLDKVRKASSGLDPFAAPSGWTFSLLATPQLTPSAPAAESRDWTSWIFGAAAVLVLLAAAGLLARRLRIRRLRLSAG